MTTMNDQLAPDDRPTDRPVSWGVSPALLKYAVRLTLLAALGFLLASFLFAPDQPERALAPALEAMVSAGALLLLSRGRVRIALLILVWATWLITSVVLTCYGGVRGTLAVLYPLLVMLGGWLLGTRSAVILAVLSALVTLALAASESAGMLPYATLTPAPLFGLVQLTCIAFSAVLIVFLVRSYHQRVSEVEQLSHDLALRTQEAQNIATDLNTAQSVAHIGSWVYEFATDMITMSAETCRLFGVSGGARGTRHRYLARVHPDDLAGLNEAWEDALAGKPLINEHRIRIDDSYRWISQRAEVEFDPHGLPVRCIGTTQDITALKQAEEELRIAATAFESKEGMMITDADTTILRVNAAFTHVTGYDPEDAIGQTPRLLKSGRHDKAFYEAMWESISHNGSWQGEIWNRRKGGELYPEWLTITAVTNERGTVTHYVGTLTDITQRKTAEDEIRHLAFYDPLTRLPNRRLLLDRLHQALASSARSGHQGALLFLDLDKFKNLNDTQGHDKGDLLLQHVAQRLSTCIREGDTVARLGGDEFVLMLVDLSTIIDETVTQAKAVSQKIQGLLNQPYDLGGIKYQSSASIGVTLFSDHQSTPFELLKQADLAMYEAKAAGRNTIRFYTPEMQLPLSARVRESI